MVLRPPILRSGCALVALLLLATACSWRSGSAPVVAEFEPVLDDALHLEPTPPVPMVEPEIVIVSPEESDIVTSPVALTLQVTAPAPNVDDREVHVFIDEPCADGGARVVVDGNRFTLASASDTIEVDLPTGFHTLCVQVMNTAAARSSAATAVVSIAIVPPETPDAG